MSDCESCALSKSRRDFLREGLIATLAVFGAVTTLHAWPREGATVRYPIPPADGAQIDKANQVILVRWKGAAYAFALSCPHQRTALRWIQGDTRFQCPKHKSKYQPDGTFISGRATRGMDRYAVKRENDAIVVDVNTLYKQDKDAAGWAAALVRLENEK